MSVTILQGDALERLREFPDESVQCCVTSPPYWGLRDYGVKSQIGLEPTTEEYLAKIVAVFSEVQRVLRRDGTCWVNMGDCYNGSGLSGGKAKIKGTLSFRGAIGKGKVEASDLKPKDLIGMPWRVAFALQSSGWYLRCDIIWHKPNPMPESVTDRPTKSHEYLFLFSKSPKYFYDAEAIKEACRESTHARLAQNVQDQIGSARANGRAKTNGNMKAVARKSWKGSYFHDGKNAAVHPNVGRNRVKDNLSMDSALAIMPEYRNKRSVWTVPTAAFSEAHFATYPPDLIRPCIRAGSRTGDTILDPFGGSGTTAQVALEEGRKAIIIELNPDYIQMIRDRTNVTPGLAI